MSREIELKLELPARALPRLRGHPLVANAPMVEAATTLENTYYDTDGYHLEARDVALRIRKRGSLRVQTVKCGGTSVGGLTQRREWEQPYQGAFDFSEIEDPELARFLADHVDRLVPVFTSRFRRETRRHSPRDDVSILMMIDRGSIEANGLRTSVCELELELAKGEPAELFDLALELGRELPLMPSDVSKAERGYRLRRGEAAHPAQPRASAVTAGQSAVDAFRALAQTCVGRWQDNVASSKVDHDPESVHQVRVALRRLRSLLKLFAPVLPDGFVERFKPLLRDNARRFDGVRDLDVFRAEVFDPASADGPPRAAGWPKLRRRVTAAGAAARREAAVALAPSVQSPLILAFIAATLRLTDGTPEKTGDLRAFARGRLERLRKRARRRLKRAEDLEAGRLHELRIAVKELRYAIEFFASLYPGRPTARYVDRLKRAQATLGSLHDLDVARDRLECWAAADPSLRAAATHVIDFHASRCAKLRKRVLADCDRALHFDAPW